MKTLFHTWLLTSALHALCLTNLFAQPGVPNHFDVTVGLSTSDALNVGLRYSFGQNSIGLNAGGALPIGGSWQLVSALSYYRHLWGHSKHTLVLPWYIKGAVHYNYSESQLTRGNFSHIRQAGARLFAGHDFNLTSRLNFSTAVGPVFLFFDEYYDNQRIKSRVIPGMDLSIFYQL